MIWNYLKIAYRNLITNKFFSIINLLGLIIGITVSILIFIWVENEVSYDKFHNNYKNIFRVTSIGSDGTGIGTPAPLSTTIQEEIPEILKTSRLRALPRITFKVGDFFDFESRGFFVDSSFFDIFSFEFISAKPENPFTDPFCVVITESLAKKYFGDKNPIGETILIENQEYFKVTGVLKDVPSNSHLQFDYLVSYKFAVAIHMFGTAWGDFNFRLYLELDDPKNKLSTIEKINEVALNHKCPQVYYEERAFSIQELEKIHLHPMTWDYKTAGSITNVYIFTFIGILIIFIACFNYINLSTAKSEKRVKEIGLRKVVGASKSKIIYQIVGESVLLTLISFNFAVILTYRLLPLFNSLTGKDLDLDFSKLSLIAFSFLILIVTGILSGLYPAFYMSRTNPVNTIKNNFNIINSENSKSSKGLLRKILVVIQFSIATALIICTLFVFKQLNHIKNSSWQLGNDLIMHIPVIENIGNKYDLIKTRLKENPLITHVSIKNTLPTVLNNNTSGVYWNGKSDEHDDIYMETLRIGYDYFKTLDMEIVKGRAISQNYPSDSTLAFILNEEALKLTGIEDPIGKPFRLYKKQGQIVGIVKNTLFKTAKQNIRAQVFHFLANPQKDAYFGSILIRINGNSLQKGDLESIIKEVKSIWYEINQNSPFEYGFLNEAIEAQYINEKRMGKIFFYFAFFAIFISCLGMLGLTYFIIESKTKEIGIRKVNGASPNLITKLFLSDFIKNILISVIFSWPISYFFISNWLKNFAYRTGISIIPFVSATIISLLIAILTVVLLVNKSANQNPVKSLRYE